jgi:hypothetical protein
MRNHFIASSLKQHFRTAWSCLPEQTRRELRNFIRQIREVNRLEGAWIRCLDGLRFGPLFTALPPQTKGLCSGYELRSPKGAVAILLDLQSQQCYSIYEVELFPAKRRLPVCRKIGLELRPIQ